MSFYFQINSENLLIFFAILNATGYVIKGTQANAGNTAIIRHRRRLMTKKTGSMFMQSAIPMLAMPMALFCWLAAMWMAPVDRTADLCALKPRRRT